MIAIGALAARLAWADPAAKSEDRTRLTVVTASAHCDWAWGHSRAWHEERYAQIIHDVLLLMRQYPHYVWQLENENEELEPFLRKAAGRWPGMIDEFWRRVRSVPATHGMPTRKSSSASRAWFTARSRPKG